MLILTRRSGGVIVIGENAEIKVTVLGVQKSGQVRLGIDAPDGVPIHREEVHERIQRERAAAARGEEEGQ